MISQTALLALTCALAACTKTSAVERECKETVAVYQPTPLEVPIADDLTAAAEKRVGADNYRRELTQIERELAALKTGTSASTPHAAK